MSMRFFLVVTVLSLSLSCSKNVPEEPVPDVLQLVSVSVGNIVIEPDGSSDGLPLDQPIVIRFAAALDTQQVLEGIQITDDQGNNLETDLSFLDNNQTISIKPTESLVPNTQYKIVIGALEGANNSLFEGIAVTFTTEVGTLILKEILINGKDLNGTGVIQDIATDVEIVAQFSHPLEVGTVSKQSVQLSGARVPDYQIELSEDLQSFTLTVTAPLEDLTRHRLILSDEITSSEGHVFEGFDQRFYTALDSTFKFPEIPDEELLTLIQKQTFKYFWDFGHPISGLARERNTSGETVTIGGSGFGVMAILVAIDRGFITREEGMARLTTIVDFLKTADRFHGVWPHWMNGTTGKTIAFSANDDGGDLVETAFMIQGLLTVRQFLNDSQPLEAALKTSITQLWEEVEWDWYTQGDQNVLYWHWSPNFGWEKNLRINGWNEALIIYVLAASSPTHVIDKEVYMEGWARGGAIVNSANNTFYGHTLDLRNDRGGPLFFAHYSFLGLDPQNLSDQYAKYWDQNVNHTLINRAYCLENPLNHVGFSEHCWGLTASDGNNGYSAHSPDNDRGVITPTAAISSIPYTPDESLEAIRHFYYLLGDQLWGEYGFYDAFNFTEGWVADSYLAIDQGPIICMIENYRTGLLWDLFMNDPEIMAGLERLNFSY